MGDESDAEFFVVDEPRSAVVAGPYASKERACEDAHERSPGHIVATRTVLEMVEVASTTTIRWENEEESDIVPDGGQQECTDQLCANEAAYALWMGDHFSRVRDPPERSSLGDGDLHPHVCEACLSRYQSHYGGHGEFVRPEHHDSHPVPDGGLESRRFVFDDHRHVSYGPRRDSDLWVLTFTDDEIGRVEILLDEDAMYELWIEVGDTPFPRDGTEAGDLRREVVHETSGMDAEMLREVLERVEEVNRGQW